ncbi:MAG: MBL fold metallo-hydrolase, partial [Gemmatimonadota bacterium]|nr:MBL fold metallo-hydrolase [Gemmatimonadota bacterium]
MKLTFLGTGTSFGVPQIGCGCAVCHSPDPRDKRNRVGAVVESDQGARLLIDTPPELRIQLIAAGIDRVDAVFFTHDHADHTHGLDDIRSISNRRDAPLDMYGPADSLARLARRFPYIFDDSVRALPGTSKPEGRALPLADRQRVSVADVDVLPIALPHGPVSVFAYRIGALAYVTDAKVIPPDAMTALMGASVLVINALFR